MTREEKIAMIGEKNLEVFPWTITRTIVMIGFLGFSGFFIILGVVYGEPFGVWLGGICAVIVLAAFFTDYFYSEKLNLVIKNPIQLKVFEFEPIEGGRIMVLGNDDKRYYLVPDEISCFETVYLKYEEKSYLQISERLNFDSTFGGAEVKLVLGKNYKEIITLS